MSKIDKVFRYAEQYAAEQYTDTGDMIKKEIESGKAELSALRARVQELENELSDEEQSRLAAQAYQEQAEARVEARVEALEAALKPFAEIPCLENFDDNQLFDPAGGVLAGDIRKARAALKA